jgi:putative transposase
LTTKIPALTDRFCCPLTLVLWPGQAGHNPSLLPPLDAHRASDTDTFRLLGGQGVLPPEYPRGVAGQPDRAHDPATQRSDRPAQGQGVRRWQTTAVRAGIYKDRNTIERGFGRLKQWRGIATRYDKYATTFLGGVLLACMITHYRVRN